ncbi:hypothetical protein Hypma_010782 [Hypsizygus marmoreus]|uniref:Uncharacterized protein n=1 Tax=Hypsizygus marmoreus TaxID=39966 RepID=A0A369JK23_HYPMA|nr:hypothetical protein Hypma_010782 [Hypsizygus marmoreus]
MQQASRSGARKVFLEAKGASLFRSPAGLDQR